MFGVYARTTRTSHARSLGSQSDKRNKAQHYPSLPYIRKQGIDNPGKRNDILEIRVYCFGYRACNVSEDKGPGLGRRFQDKLLQPFFSKVLALRGLEGFRV